MNSTTTTASPRRDVREEGGSPVFLRFTRITSERSDYGPRTLNRFLDTNLDLEPGALTPEDVEVLAAELGPLASSTLSELAASEKTERWGAAMRAYLQRSLPLFINEYVRDEGVRALVRDSELGPKGGLAYVRDTNFAEQVFVSSTILSDDEMAALARVTLNSTSESESALASPLSRKAAPLIAGQNVALSTIIETLGLGIISGIGGKIAAAVIDAAFPPSTSYFQEVYQEISDIVKQSLIQENIDTINDQLNGIAATVRTTYLPFKETNPEKRKELFNRLDPLQQNLIANMLPILQSPRASEAALPVFLVAANTNIALLQELAFVDPSQLDPNESSYAQSVRIAAREYLEYTPAIWKAVRDKRSAFITGAGERRSRNCRRGQGACFAHCDGFDRFESEERLVRLSSSTSRNCPCTRDDVRCASSRDRKVEGHRAAVLASLTRALGSPDDIIEGWRRLEEDPLPDSEAARP